MNTLHGCLTCLHIHRETREMCRMEKIVRIFHPEIVVTSGIDNHIITLLVGVHNMKNKTGRNIEPFNIRIGAIARHNAKAARSIVIPFKGQTAARDRHRPGKPDRHFHKHDIVIGHSKIVNHTRAGHLDRLDL